MELSQSKILDGAGTGNGPAHEVNFDGPWTYYLKGDLSGATVTFEVSIDGVTWVDIGFSETSAGVGRSELSVPFIRGVVTGGGTPSVDCWVIRGRTY